MEPINKDERQKASLRATVIVLLLMLGSAFFVGLYFASKNYNCEDEKGQEALAMIDLMTETRDTFAIRVNEWEEKFREFKGKYKPYGDPQAEIEMKNYERTIELFLAERLDKTKEGVKTVDYILITKFQKELREIVRERETYMKDEIDKYPETEDPSEEAKEVDWQERYTDLSDRYQNGQANLQNQRDKVSDLKAEVRRLKSQPTAQGSSNCPPVTKCKDCEEYKNMKSDFRKFITSVDMKIEGTNGNRIKKIDLAPLIARAKAEMD